MSVSQITVGGVTVDLVATPLSPELSDVEWGVFDGSGISRAKFTGAVQAMQWHGGDMLSGVAHLPPLAQADADSWITFLEELRGTANAFQLYDPAQPNGRGSGAGTPLVDNTQNGGNPAGSQALGSKGWTASAQGVLWVGDWIQVGYRLYRVLDTVNADASGNAVLSIWPSLREQPADGAAIIDGISPSNVNATGTVTMTSSAPLGNWYWAMLWSAFRTPTLPSDAVIEGIYPVIVASAVHDQAFCNYEYGPGLSLTNPVSGQAFNTPFNPDSTSFSSTEFYDLGSGPPYHGIGTSLAALSGQEIMVILYQTLSRSGMSDTAAATAVGFAVYYTSATPVTDPLIPPPFTVPAGQGLAWSIPTASAVTPPIYTNGSAVATPNGGQIAKGLFRLTQNKRDWRADIEAGTAIAFAFEEYR